MFIRGVTINATFNPQLDYLQLHDLKVIPSTLPQKVKMVVKGVVAATEVDPMIVKDC